MSVRKSSHGTIFLIVSSGSPRALIASSLRSTSKKPFCPMTRSLHPPMTACGHRVRFARTWREGFFEVPLSIAGALYTPFQPKGRRAGGWFWGLPEDQMPSGVSDALQKDRASDGGEGI